jgi:hypothetical protein
LSKARAPTETGDVLAQDADQERRRKRLLLGRGAVLVSLGYPLAAELDISGSAIVAARQNRQRGELLPLA